MKKLTRMFLGALTLLTLAGSLTLTGCWVEVQRDPQGREYRHRRWHGEHVYQREDGHWHARRNGLWVVVDGVTVE
jgi:hypothetical protein